MIGILCQLSDNYPQCLIIPFLDVLINYMLKSWKNGQKFGWYH